MNQRYAKIEAIETFVEVFWNGKAAQDSAFSLNKTGENTTPKGKKEKLLHVICTLYKMWGELS